MRLTIVIEGQEGVTWEEWVAVAEACEEAGLDGLFVADHYLSTVSTSERGTLDAWATIAALAARTSRIRLGSLVSPATFRHPANLARVVTTADHVSGGRVELGLGSGWYEPEHSAFGFALPPLGGRMALLDEQLAVIEGLWRGEPFRHDGPAYRLDTPEVLPVPLQRPRPTVIVGGTGKPRTIDIAVRRADEYNTPYATPADCRERAASLREACEAAGRDPSSLVFSAMPTCIVGSDRADYDRRARALSRGLGNPGEDPVTELAHRAVGGIFGIVDEMIEAVRAFADAGVERLHLQHLAPSDTEMIRLIGAEVAPAVAG